MNEHLSLERSGEVAWITINRPERKNAFLSEMVTRLAQIGEEVSNDETCRVVVLRGVGGDFCSGSDVSGIAEGTQRNGPDRTKAADQGLATTIQPLLRTFLGMRQPIVVSARGYAIGLGVQFLLFADLVVASETLKVMVPQVRLGHALDHGESYLLPRRIGHAKAMELALLGEAMSGADAERFGLVNFLTRDEELEATTDTVVAKLLRVSPDALWRSKALVRESQTNDLEAQLAAERKHVSTCMGTEDFVEAIAAFREKREPQFIGA